MLTALSKDGLFKNDSVWFTAYYVYNTVWNLSDASLLCAQCLGEAGMVRLCAANIAHEPYKDNMKQKVCDNSFILDISSQYGTYSTKHGKEASNVSLH